MVHAWGVPRAPHSDLDPGVLMFGSEAAAELLVLGFSQASVARVAGGSLEQMEEWRKIKSFPRDAEIAMAVLLSTCREIEDDYGISEPAEWFEAAMPGSSTRPLDLWQAGHHSTVLAYASGLLPAEDLLALFEADDGDTESWAPQVVLVDQEVADDLVAAIDWIASALDLHPEDALWGLWQENVSPALDRYVRHTQRPGAMRP